MGDTTSLLSWATTPRSVRARLRCRPASLHLDVVARPRSASPPHHGAARPTLPFRLLLPDPSSLAPPRRRQGRQPVAAVGADAPPGSYALRVPHPAAHGGATAPPARNGAAIPNPSSAIHGGASGSTSALRRTRPSKKASGASAAQFPPAPVLVPMHAAECTS